MSEIPSLKSSNISSDELLNSEFIGSSLTQNSPNPFSDETNIEYYVDDIVNKASLVIYDINGQHLRNYQIESKGSGLITIEGGELNPGMYLYTLITDGKVVDTKQMFLTD